MKKKKKLGSGYAAGISKTSKSTDRGWAESQLAAMPLKQFMEQCPHSESTAGLRWNRLSDEALSLDVLQDIAQDPSYWDYEKGLGTGYETELFVFIQNLAEEHGVPCRCVSMRSARDARDNTIGLSTHYEFIGFASGARLSPSLPAHCETFWFVHPSIVPVLENAADFSYLSSSPLWLLFKARYYLNGSLSADDHSFMLQHATMGNCHAKRYLDYAATSPAAQGVRQPEPAYLPTECMRNVSLVLSNDDLAHELDVSRECLRTMTGLMDSSGLDWYSDYLSDQSDVVVSTDGDLDEDGWDQLPDEQHWDFAGYFWKPEVVSLLRRHVAFPLAKLQHGHPVSEKEHERMSWTHEVIADYADLVAEYMKLTERQQKTSSGGQA